MKFGIRKLLLCCALTLSAGAAIALDVGDCSKALTKDYYADSAKRSLQVDFLKTIDQSTWQELKTDASINLIVAEVPLGANYAEFDKTRTTYLEKQKYRRSEFEAHNIIKTVTSDRAYTAYEACLRAADTGSGLRVWASKETMDIIELRVLYRNPPNKPSVNLIGQVEGGTVLGAPSGSLWNDEKKIWGINVERIVRVRRQPGTSETAIIVSSDDGASPVSLTFNRADGVVRLRFDGTVDVLRQKGVSGPAVNTPNNDNNKGSCPNSTGKEGKYCRSRTSANISTTAPKFLANVAPHCSGSGCGWTKGLSAVKISDTEYQGFIENWGPVASLYLTADLYERLGPASCGSQSEIPVIKGISTVFSLNKECLPMARLEWKKLPSGDQGSVAFANDGDATLKRNGEIQESAGVITAAYRLMN